MRGREILIAGLLVASCGGGTPSALTMVSAPEPPEPRLSPRWPTPAAATVVPTPRPTHTRRADRFRVSDAGPVSGGVRGLNWHALALCESGDNPRAVSRTGKYRGLYQFSLATWHSVGGVGDPIDASRQEQTYRAQLLYQRSGAGQWPVCGRRL